MPNERERSWADRFEQTACLTLGSFDPAAFTAAAERVTRKRTARWLLESLNASTERTEVPGAGPDADSTAHAVTASPRDSLDELLLAARVGRAPVPEAPSAWRGPLVQQSVTDAIEVWTETELAAVHAAWSLPSWHDGARVSARWLLDEIQPDNATNLPWSAHVFAALACTEDSAEAGMYADTLLHNCMVGSGRPDPLSALILADCATQLRGPDRASGADRV